MVKQFNLGFSGRRTPEVNWVNQLNSSLRGERVSSLPLAWTAAPVLKHEHVGVGVTGAQVVTGALSAFGLQRNIRERSVQACPDFFNSGKVNQSSIPEHVLIQKVSWA